MSTVVLKSPSRFLSMMAQMSPSFEYGSLDGLSYKTRVLAVVACAYAGSTTQNCMNPASNAIRTMSFFMGFSSVALDVSANTLHRVLFEWWAPRLLVGLLPVIL